MKHVKLTAIAISVMAIFTPVTASAFVIDDFSVSQSVTDRGNTAGSTSNTLINLTATGINRISRTLTAESTGNSIAHKTKVQVGNQTLSVSNNDGATGWATLDWQFDNANFNPIGNALMLMVNGLENRPSDPSVTVEMIVNGTSSSGVKQVNTLGDLTFNFNDFSVNSVMSSVHSLRLKFSGPFGWDAQFGPLSIVQIVTPDFAPVPVPASLYTMASALLGFIGLSRRKGLHAFSTCECR